MGFPVPEGGTPTFTGQQGFFSKAPVEFQRSGPEFYQYTDGDLGPSNPGVIFGLRSATMARGEAYWINTGDYYNRYFGPVEISLPESGLLNYGDKGRVIGVRIRNVTASPLTVTLSLKASEAAPAGQAAVTGVVPLLVREARTLSWGWTARRSRGMRGTFRQGCCGSPIRWGTRRWTWA